MDAFIDSIGGRLQYGGGLGSNTIERENLSSLGCELGSVVVNYYAAGMGVATNPFTVYSQTDVLTCLAL
eukprot:6663676-Ditylum_brightwellii.AAC.1